MITFSIVVLAVSFFQRTYLSVPLVKLEKIRPLAIVEKKLFPNYWIEDFLEGKNLLTLDSVILG
jgi:hypothetical protein